jgi:hypothetical protein
LLIGNALFIIFTGTIFFVERKELKAIFGIK